MQISKDTHKKFKEELQNRKEVILPKLQEAFQKAVEEGDGPHDNQLYQVTKHELDLNYERITELENILRDAEIIDIVEGNTTVQLGHKIRIKDESGSEKEITIVEDFEIDISLGKISSWKKERR